MDDLLNKTRYNNLIRPATSSSQLVSIKLQLTLAQLISVVGVEGVERLGQGSGEGQRVIPPTLQLSTSVCRVGIRQPELYF